VSGEANPLGSFTLGYVGTTSRMSNVTYPNGQTTTYSYFGNLGDHRLQQVLNRLPGSVTLSKFDYTYDVLGNVSTWTQQAGSNPAKVYTLEYDVANEMSTAIVSGPSPLPVPSRFAYAYDSAGNRTAEQLDDAVTGATYNNRNQLVATQAGGALLFRGTLNETATVTIGGQPAQVGPTNSFLGQAQVPSGTSNVSVAATDASGNVRTNVYQVSESATGKAYAFDSNGSLTGDGLRTFDWDAETRLVAVNQGTHRSEFTYDGRGRRTRIVERDSGVVTTDRRFIWCDKDPCEERDSTGSIVVRRFFEYGMQEGATAYFYAGDHLGSIHELTDGTTALRARYDYDPWGRRTKISGDKDSAVGFTGHFYHTATGLSLTWFRGLRPFRRSVD
jgi:YD repeat-containing protein